MNPIVYYTQNTLLEKTNIRTGETKWGQNLSTLSSLEELTHHSAKYVLLGIPEDIGVRANHGKPGTSGAWNYALEALCNIQVHDNNLVNEITLLGHIQCETEMKNAASISKNDTNYLQKLGDIVEQIDKKVAFVIQKIVASGKKPIVIGGGHNNSYGMLKGSSIALAKPVNCINLDAHTDFRALEHRHSGNGFSFAYKDHYLKKYYLLGIHNNYTSQAVFNELHKHKDDIAYSLFEAMFVSKSSSFDLELNEGIAHVNKDNFGIELDLDAVQNFASSAISPSGVSFQEARNYIYKTTAHHNWTYLHICEGAPNTAVIPQQIGKAIAYLISDALATY